MGIFDFLQGKASPQLLQQLESADSNLRLAAALQVAQTRDKVKAADPLIRHYEEDIGVGRYVTRKQWEEALQKWRQDRKLKDVVLFIKLDVVSSFQVDGIDSRLKKLRDLAVALEGIAKSTG